MYTYTLLWQNTTFCDATGGRDLHPKNERLLVGFIHIYFSNSETFFATVNTTNGVHIKFKWVNDYIRIFIFNQLFNTEKKC